MAYYEDQAIYHIVNLLIIFVFAFIYTAIKTKMSLHVDIAHKPQDHQEEQKTNDELQEASKNEEYTQPQTKSFLSEVLKNFLAGIVIYLLYIFYQSFKP